MYSLDEIDKNLLALLDQDARQSVTMLAHKLGVSKQVVSFRLRRLEKEGIIQEYSAYIDRARLGYQHHQLYLKLAGYDFKNLLLDLSSLPHIHWCAASGGKYDLVIYFLTNNQADCYHTYSSILQKFSGYILSKDYLVTSKSHYFNQSAITYMEKKQVMVQMPQKRPRLKPQDFNLINLIKPNARISIVDISKSIGLSPRTIKDRLKYLQKVGVIRNFRARLNYTNLGYRHYQIFFEANNISDNQRIKILTSLIAKREVIRLTETLGKWDISCDVVLPNGDKILPWVKQNVDKKILIKTRLSHIEIKQMLGVNTSIYKH